MTARRLMRSLDRATLATSLPGGGGGGWPYASLVLIAADLDASPLLLISDLAEHTKNLHQYPRASLLFDATAGRDDPLTGSRVTVLGEISRDTDPAAPARFLRRHPSAAAYAGFKDFHPYRMHVTRGHLVAGFGRIHWVEGSDLLLSAAATDWLREAETDILQHMNVDHAQTIDLYAQKLLGRSSTGWQMTGIDPEGADLRCGGDVARLDFSKPITGPEDTRQTFAALAQSARRREPSH